MSIVLSSEAGDNLSPGWFAVAPSAVENPDGGDERKKRFPIVLPACR
jgi:hypothetical protein